MLFVGIHWPTTFVHGQRVATSADILAAQPDLDLLEVPNNEDNRRLDLHD